jgi:hypothetical protein
MNAFVSIGYIEILYISVEDLTLCTCKYFRVPNEEFIVGHTEFAHANLALCPVHGHKTEALWGYTQIAFLLRRFKGCSSLCYFAPSLYCKYK